MYDKPLSVYLPEPTNEVEENNVNTAVESIKAVLGTPHTQAAALMPDACPAGPVGVIPVGGVVSSDRIHPGMHSADVCCSVALSFFTGMESEEVFDKYKSNTHFGVGGREDMPLHENFAHLIENNLFTQGLLKVADEHFGTQGDGNHFGVVGTSGSMSFLVTHHGSRGFGAAVFKRAMEIAVDHLHKSGSDALDYNAWIPKELQEEYWDALQIVRNWTYLNHQSLHNNVGSPTSDIVFTPHNFVFKKRLEPDTFYHAKGSTPMWEGFSRLIPMNMRDGVLMTTQHTGAPDGSLGFAPHGAGRNMSRMAFRRSGVKPDLGRVEAHFFSGHPDVSEMPEAYKSADVVISEIENHKLAHVNAVLEPEYSLMAGLQPWEVKRLIKKGLYE